MATSRKEFLVQSLAAAAGSITGLDLSSFEKELESGTGASTAPNMKQEMPISIFSKHLEWLDYGSMAETASELGFDGVDLTVRPGGHVLPERVTKDLPRAVEAVRSAGLNVYMISTAIGDVDEKHTNTILKTASELGIGHYRMNWYSYDDSLSIPQNLDHFKRKLSRLADINEKYQIRGDYQNHSGSGFGASIWDLWMVLKEIDNPWIGAQYDIRHATVEGAESWPVGFKLIHSRIGTLDIKDFHWNKLDGSWEVQNVPLGEGQVNFPRYFELIKKLGFSAPLSLHYEYPLGGAEHGDTKLTIPRQKVLTALKRDLETLRGWLQDFDLG